MDFWRGRSRIHRRLPRSPGEAGPHHRRLPGDADRLALRRPGHGLRHTFPYAWDGQGRAGPARRCLRPVDDGGARAGYGRAGPGGAARPRVRSAEAPLAALVLHINREVIHHGADICRVLPRPVPAARHLISRRWAATLGILGVRADRELLGVTGRHPDLATQGDDGRAAHRAVHDLVLVHVVREPLWSPSPWDRSGRISVTVVPLRSGRIRCSPHRHRVYV